MDEKLETAIEKSLDLLLNQFKPGTAAKPDDCQKYSQAFLNLCHAKALLEGKSKKSTS